MLTSRRDGTSRRYMKNAACACCHGASARATAATGQRVELASCARQPKKKPLRDAIASATHMRQDPRVRAIRVDKRDRKELVNEGETEEAVLPLEAAERSRLGWRWLRRAAY